MNFITKYFKLEEKNTTIKKESIAGLTTFLAMAYIIPTNTFLLANTGMPVAGIFIGTILSTVVATLIMGIYANYPIALAPGMGLNAFFAFVVVLYGYGFSWQEGLATVFVSGILFLFLSISKIREHVINSIPKDLKHAICTGIGFFIAFLGLKSAGIIVGNEATLVSLGNFTFPPVALAIFGLVFTLILHIRGNNFAIIIGMVITTIIGLVLNSFGVANMPSYTNENSLSDLSSFKDVFGAFLPYVTKVVTTKEGWLAIFTFVFVDFLDTAGTLIAVGNEIGIISKDGKLENGSKALLADSVGTVAGSFFGMPPVTSFIESMAGIKVGGRTGLTAVVASFLFLASILTYPLLSIINGISVMGYGGNENVVLSPITAPALILVGSMMMANLKKIDWKDDSVTISSFFVIIFMILTFSIAEGIAVGFIVFTLSKLAKKEKVNMIMIILSILFVLKFVFA